MQTHTYTRVTAAAPTLSGQHSRASPSSTELPAATAAAAEPRNERKSLRREATGGLVPSVVSPTQKDRVSVVFVAAHELEAAASLSDRMMQAEAAVRSRGCTAPLTRPSAHRLLLRRLRLRTTSVNDGPRAEGRQETPEHRMSLRLHRQLRARERDN